jgi:hypothetical protein
VKLSTSFTCDFMRYWAALYRGETQKMINYVVELMMKTTLRQLRKQGSGDAILALKNDVADKEDQEG